MTTKTFVRKFLKFAKFGGRQLFNKPQPPGTAHIPPGEKTQVVAERVYLEESVIARTFRSAIYPKIHPSQRTQSLATLLLRKHVFPSRSGALFSFAVGLAMCPNNSEDDADTEESLRMHFHSRDNKAQTLKQKTFNIFEVVQSLSLKELQLGEVIGQGCNAAVHEARLVDDTDIESQGENSDDEDIVILRDMQMCQADEVVTPSSQTMCVPCLGSSNKKIEERFEEEFEDDFVILSKMSDDMLENEDEGQNLTVVQEHQDKQSSVCFPLAVKVFFNYGVESNSELILREMERELVPASFGNPDNPYITENVFVTKRTRLKCLPEHPNIVEIYGVFVDSMEEFPGALSKYPDALPPRLHESGYGRNLTMFMIMKRYTSTLSDYLLQNNPSLRTRCLLLSQLLEGVWHINDNNIAHRDIKSNNLFVDCEGKGIDEAPNLVIGDFGCCLADPNYGLRLPYIMDGIDRGGNVRLMAPEIINAIPGGNVWLDYSKADLWACGTIFYEIFGCENPFSNGTCHSGSYCDKSLPSLPEGTPKVFTFILKHLLKSSLKERMDHLNALNLVNSYLWFPEWLVTMPSKQDVCLTLGALATGLRIAGMRRDTSLNVERQAQQLWLAHMDVTLLLKHLKMYHLKVNC